MSRELHDRLKEMVFSTDKETGALLLGKYDGETARVLHLVGPGEKAKHHKYHYEADNAYQERVYNELLKENPSLEHLGEFHVHPGAMRELSCGDYRTVRKVMKGYDRYVAGVILREVWHWDCRYGPEAGPRKIRIHPVYFTKEKEEACEFIVE